jgi:hypothetical protein
MVHKLALGIGGLAAVGVLVLAMAVGGLAAKPARAQELVASAPTAAPTTQTQVDTVYVKPVPPAAVVHVTKTAKPSKTTAPRVITVTVKRPGGGEGGDQGERDGGD